MTNNISQIRQKLYERKNRIGLIGGTIKVETYDEAEHPVEAHIAPHGWNIEIRVREGFDPIQDRRQKAYTKRKKITEGLETLLTDILLHECAHWELPHDSGKGCPYDINYHDQILEAIQKGLPNDKQRMASYVTNAFEDLMINPRCHEFNGSFNGQVLFWDNEGLLCREKGQKTFAPFYEAFVKLNMHLFGDKIDNALLKRHYGNGKDVEKAVREIVNKLSLTEHLRPTDPLFDKVRWPDMAYQFAKAMSPLLESQPQERLSAFSGKQGDGSGSGKQEQAGNGIEQKMGTKEGAEEVAYGRYSSGNKLSPHFTSFEQLDGLYQRLSRPIQVRVESITKQFSLPIAPLTFRKFDEEKDDPMKVKLSKLYVGDEGLTFGYEDKPLSVEFRSKVQRRSFPDFKMVLLDNSGSMRQAPDGTDNIGNTNIIPWGDNSKYHYALLGLYGIEQFLQRQGIAQYINHGLTLFSSGTRYKEGDFSQLDTIKKYALSPDWGNTNLDATALIRALKGRESFLLSMSDGEIGNWASERESFKAAVKGNHYAHIQLGAKSQFAREIEGWNVPVFYVSSGQELAHLMVDVTKETYRRYIKQ